MIDEQHRPAFTLKPRSRANADDAGAYDNHRRHASIVFSSTVDGFSLERALPCTTIRDLTDVGHQSSDPHMRHR